MHIVMVSSEAVPFSKTGGLGDVVPALCKTLSELGHAVTLITPHYPQKWKPQDGPLQVTGKTVTVSLREKNVTGHLLRYRLAGSHVDVILIDQNDYFDRPELYQENGIDYADNAERFIFFSRAAKQAILELGIVPDVLHVHDWQTALIPALLKIEAATVPSLQNTATVFTIHNLAFQGNFFYTDMELTGLDWKYFNWEQMEFFGHLNLLKSGIVFADRITTVSPTYAKEIQTERFGSGMELVLQRHRGKLSGILNGIDETEWNPATDRFLKINYDCETVSDGKPICKNEIQKSMGLPEEPRIPLLGIVSRLTDQKGISLLVEIATELFQRNLQLVVLGTGEKSLESQLESLQKKYPQKLAVQIGFDNALAHQIEAGADLFLMPSKYEPCGLNQLYSLKYGTIPLVHAVGGLADSVVDATEEHLRIGTANGFRFEKFSAGELVKTLDRATNLYRDPEVWAILMRSGMRHDWSWKRSSLHYLEVYENAKIALNLR